jgi:hypothetical protein
MRRLWMRKTDLVDDEEARARGAVSEKGAEMERSTGDSPEGPSAHLDRGPKIPQPSGGPELEKGSQKLRGSGKLQGLHHS